MKLVPAAQNALEWFALKAGMVPTPLAYSHFGFQMSKILMEAVDQGVFEAIGLNKLSVDEVCIKTNLNKRALTSLLGVLASMGLVRETEGLLKLTYEAKKWLLKDSPHSLYWMILFDNRVCYKWMEYTGDFLKTGKGLQYHESLNEEEWYLYQKAMEAIASSTAKEAARKTRMPAGAKNMLDIGGSHGLYSIELCKKYKDLRATVFDLPAAVDKAAPIAAAYDTENKVTYLAGDILTDEIGKERYDAIVMVNVAHHFTGDENVAVAKKAYNALRPGGTFSIMEILRLDRLKYKGDMLGALGDFYFALTSTSGTWSHKEISGWLTNANFISIKKSSFLSLPGFVTISGVKS